MDYEKDERNMPDKPKIVFSGCDNCKFNNHCSFQAQVPEGMAVTRCEIFRPKEAT